MSSGKRQQGGFTYLTALLVLAAMGTGLVSIAELWSHARQRENEMELQWIGAQFKQAIGLYYHASPGAVKRYPETLEDLLDDRRHLATARYLRRIYADPMTGKSDWGMVKAAGGGIMGVHSLSQNIAIRQKEFGRTSADWRFIYVPSEPNRPGR